MAANKYERSLFSYLIVLIKHVIKWYSQPELRSSSWVKSIQNAREAIQDLLTDHPSLRRLIDILIPKAIRKAIQEAENEMGTSSRIDPDGLDKGKLFDDDYFV